ncbi:MAG TPA: hypothetical protein VEZ12_02705 [Herpetosiphonaceae bacterium]|jgi:hypothetical protein|nr:hypothetical protein [Herpetosiphonaceae bacterium]
MAAGIPDSSGEGEQEQRKQLILDYFCEHIDQSLTPEQVADAVKLSTEDVEIAIEALAYEKELAKEYDEGGLRTFRRKA